MILDDAQVGQYRTDGFIIVRGAFSAGEVANLDAEAARVFGLDEPVSDLSPAIGQFARDPRMIGIVSALYDERAHRCRCRDRSVIG